MAKRSFTIKPVLASQERGTVNTYRNRRNPNKYIEVKKGNDGHSYARQYMEWDTPSGKVKNYTGAADPKRGRYSRATRDTIDQMTEDYDEVSSSTDTNSELEEITAVMYGDYECSCGCGAVLGRPTNGTDGDPVEYSYGVGETSDEEGYDWRMFTEQCWDRISSEMSLDDIYNEYPPAPVI